MVKKSLQGQFQALVADLQEKEDYPLPVFLPGENAMDRGSWWTRVNDIFVADHVTAHISKLVIHLSGFRRNNVPIQCSRWTKLIVSFRLLLLKFLIT